MRKTETVLGIIQDRGKRGLHLEDAYRQLFNPDLYLCAYGRLYRNKGAMTKGVTAETVDGMSVRYAPILAWKVPKQAQLKRIILLANLRKQANLPHK